ncbi:hypothetical protein C4587_01140 [Candidatus Parcubacteria bacterium]|nr:MAG: hypothetical protein C4587_01140 [Candidatus Parcubacteria bacterium]
MQPMRWFFAVTTGGSIFRVRVDQGIPVVEEGIIDRMGFLPCENRSNNEPFIAVTRSLGMYLFIVPPETERPLGNNGVWRVEEIPEQRLGFQIRDVAGLFTDRWEALECVQAESRRPWDETFLRATRDAVAAIGANHPFIRFSEALRGEFGIGLVAAAADRPFEAT